jgi:hypothetical protein
LIQPEAGATVSELPNASRKLARAGVAVTLTPGP